MSPTSRFWLWCLLQQRKKELGQTSTPSTIKLLKSISKQIVQEFLLAVKTSVISIIRKPLPYFHIFSFPFYVPLMYMYLLE